VMAKPFEINKIKATIQNILAKKTAVPADSQADKE